MHIATPDPTCFPHNYGRPDILDIALIKGLHITDGPFTVHALTSDHIQIRLDVQQRNFLFLPSLPSIHTVNWDKYRILPTETTNTQIKLNNVAEIDKAVKLITANIKSAIRISTNKSTFTNKSTEITSPEQLRTHFLITLKRWARKKMANHQRSQLESPMEHF